MAEQIMADKKEPLKGTVAGTLNCKFKDCDQMIWAFLPNEKLAFDALTEEAQREFINIQQEAHNKVCLAYQRSIPKN
jgi:hypothetical protein